MQVKAIGIAWYRREHYRRLKEMFSDGWKLADTFDEWSKSAQGLYDKLTAEGHVVEKAYIHPETFPQWCKANGFEMDARARTHFGNEFVAKKLMQQ